MTIKKNGLTFESNILCVDLEKWTTPAQLTKKLKVKKNIITNMITRGQLERIKIDQLKLSLVPNLLDINELDSLQKKPRKKV